MRKGIGAGVCGGAVNDFVGIIEAERDGITVLQFTAFHLFAVDEQTPALTAIFDVKLARFGDDSSAVARDAAIGKLQMVAGFGAAPDQKRHLCHAYVTPR